MERDSQRLYSAFKFFNVLLLVKLLLAKQREALSRCTIQLQRSEPLGLLNTPHNTPHRFAFPCVSTRLHAVVGVRRVTALSVFKRLFGASQGHSRWYREGDSNPHGAQAPTDFKSVASTNSAIPASLYLWLAISGFWGRLSIAAGAVACAHARTLMKHLR